jgi:type II secretion system protein D
VEQKADLAVRVLPLQHAVAKELAPEIGPLALKALGGAPGQSVEITPSARSNALIVLSTEAGFEAVKSVVASLDVPGSDVAVRILPLQHAMAKELAPEIGPLALKALGGAPGQSVEITPSTRSNALIVLSSASAFETVKGIVSSLDAPAAARPSPLKVFKLEHAPADRIRDILKPLLSPLGKVEIEEHLRKVIVTDNPDNVHFFEQLVRELDVPAGSDFQTVVVTLGHAEADELTDLLNSVYSEGGKAAASGPLKPDGVRIFSDDIGNRIVIVAGKEKMEDVKSLVSALDVEKPADFTLRVISLQFVSAKDLAEEIEPLYQRSSRPSRERLEIAGNSRSNSLLVLSSASDFAAIQEIVSVLDTKDAEEKTMKAFVLKNADADDVSSQLTDLYRDTDGDDYYSYYYYGRRRGGGDDEAKVRFVSDRRRNAVIAIAPPARIESLAPVIESLDEPIEGEQLVPKIYTLKFVSALDVETVLNELFLKRTQRRSYYYYEEDSQEEHRDIGRLYGKIRIASEPYTNALIVSSNSAENFSAVEEILKQLDVPSQTGSSTLYLQLKYAKAVTIANNVNILFAGAGSPARRAAPQEGQPQNRQEQQGQQGRTSTTTTSFELEQEVQEESYYPWLGGGGGQQDGSRGPGSRTSITRPVSDLVGKVRVVPDVRTNSLMITSNLHFFPQIMKVVEELDIPTSQVLIEAKIIEVGRDDKERLGVRWSPDGAQVFDRDDLDNSVIASTSTTYRQVFAGSALADAVRTGILDVSVDLDFLIQFLQKNANSRVRAEPRINVADNERGKLFVGSRVPFITNSLTTVEGGRNDAFEYIDVGIILEVTPHINNKNEVDLKIRVEASQLRPGETLFGGAIIDTRNYRTDITVQSGETLVLGGIIQSEESEIERKVPLIGDIPFLGWLFKKRDTVNRDIELMVFLKPTVTKGPEDVRRLMEEETRKTPQIQRFDRKLDAQRALESQEVEEELREMEPLPYGAPPPPPVLQPQPQPVPPPAEDPRPPASRTDPLEARAE